MDVLSRHIEVTPGVAGGKARIAGHRITVHNVVVWHERIGMSPDQISAEFGLSLADVHAALAYYFDHQDQIDAEIAADQAAADELRKHARSLLRNKLGLGGDA